MSFDIGIDFRDTSGYVTDPANCTYCLGGDAYPTVRAGSTFGWLSVPAEADIDNSRDPRIAGWNYNIASIDFQLDLPASGSVDLRLAGGDSAITTDARHEILDNTTSKILLTPSTPSAGQLFDATGTFYSAANWPASNTAVNKTFATTTLIMKLGGGSSYSVIAHLRATQASVADTLFAQAIY